MTTEYWLQKKTIGGWSHVTSYQDEEQARKNYSSCVGNGMSGYSWRLVEVKTIQEDMLNDVVEVQQPDNAKLWIQASGRIDRNAIGLEPIKSGWGKPVQDAPKSSWGTSSAGWGDFKAPINPEADTAPSGEQPHGLTGSVWLVHYGLKDKKRVAANLVDDMIAQGWQRGGPRTQFEGG